MEIFGLKTTRLELEGRGKELNNRSVSLGLSEEALKSLEMKILHFSK